jgi:hypothetical protein
MSKSKPIPTFKAYDPREETLKSFAREYSERPKTLSEGIERWLPYGMWTCADGREVLFNRGYRPIWERRPGKAAQKANPGEWVDWIKQEWFFHVGEFGTTKKAERARAPVERALLDFLYGGPVRGSD